MHCWALRQPPHFARAGHIWLAPGSSLGGVSGQKRKYGCGYYEAKEGRKEMFYLTTHSTHFIYGYMVSGIWLRTTQIVREETRCRHMGYSFRLAARVLYMHHPIDRIAYNTAFITSVVEHWLEREIHQWDMSRRFMIRIVIIASKKKEKKHP